MAIKRSKKTDTLRADPEFKRWVESLSRMKAAQENEKITPSRITQAIYKQYLKYPELQEEIKKAKLGRWKSL